MRQRTHAATVIVFLLAVTVLSNFTILSSAYATSPAPCTQTGWNALGPYTFVLNICEDSGGTPEGTVSINFVLTDLSSGTSPCNGQSCTYINPFKQVVLTPLPKSGYFFDHWTVDGVTYTNNPITINWPPNHLVNLYFATQFDFSLSTPASVTVTQGSSTSTSITVTLTAGTTQSVSLSSSQSSGLTITFNPASSTPSYTSSIGVQASSLLSQGTYTVSVQATGGGVSHSTSFTVTVNAAPPPQYAITVNTNPIGLDSPSGGGTYISGTGTTISVSNVAGYTFNQWNLDGSFYSTSQSFSYTVTAAHTFTAVFTVVVQQQTLTAKVDSGSGSINPNCPSGCPENVGALITVTASPSSGWQFGSWSTQTGTSCSSATCNFYMPSNTVTLGATFTQISPTQYALVTRTDSGSGSVVPNCPSGCMENVGASVTVTASPGSGWLFSSWSTQTGISSCSVSSCSFTMPSNAVTLGAAFTQTQTFTTGTDAGSGSVVPNCPSGCGENVGASVSVTASAASGWQFSSWSTQTGIASCSTSSCTFTMPNNAVTLKATFTVLPSFDFVIPTPTSVTVQAGQSGTTNINVNLVSGPTQSAGLTVSGLPSGATGTFNPANGNPSYTSTLTISTSSSTPTGSTTVTVTGSSGTLTHSITFTLTVQSGPPSTYPLTVTSTPTTHGNPNYLGTAQISIGSQVSLYVTSPEALTADTRWICQGYVLDNNALTTGTSVTVTMNAAHSVQWVWQKQVQVALQSNIPNWGGYVTLTGGGWQAGGSTIQIVAPASVNVNSVTWSFQQWVIVSGQGMFSTDPKQRTVSVTLQSDPTVEADYVQASSTTTCSTCTSTSGTSTGAGNVQVRFQIIDKNAASLQVYGANVTVTNVNGQNLWIGQTDNQGYAPANVSPMLLLPSGQPYIIRVTTPTRSFSQQRTADTEGIIVVDISQSQTFTSIDQQLWLSALFFLILIVVAVGIIAQQRSKHKHAKQSRWNPIKWNP